MQSYDNICLNDGSELSEQEIFILRQVEGGHIADIKKKHIRASFLKELFTDSLGNIYVKSHGVRIMNAIIVGGLDLSRNI